MMAGGALGCVQKSPNDESRSVTSFDLARFCNKQIANMDMSLMLNFSSMIFNIDTLILHYIV